MKKTGNLRPGSLAASGKRKGALIAALLLPLLTGAVSALLTREGMAAYAALRKPPLSPPGWVFPAAWTVLYLLMGYASWRVAVSPAPEERKGGALSLYAVQLAANFLWPLLFFGMERRFLAFFWLLLLLALVLLTWDRFRQLDRSAGRALIPYVVWLCFAAYLNLGAAFLNR